MAHTYEVRDGAGRGVTVATLEHAWRIAQQKHGATVRTALNAHIDPGADVAVCYALRPGLDVDPEGLRRVVTAEFLRPACVIRRTGGAS
jgi:hypothetical protein